MSNRTASNADSVDISKSGVEELQERSNPAEMRALNEDRDQRAFTWADEKSLQRFVKMLCTNYNLEQL